MSETEKNEDEAVRIARDHIDKAERNIHPDRCASCTMARYIVEQHNAREAARASMPRVVREAVDRVEWGPPMVSAEGLEYAAALIAAHEREAELRAALGEASR